jgi:DNA-directed RNA polymerase specialized sigma24 family protein
LSDQGAAVRSRAEIESAICAFTNADWARLRSIAHAYALPRRIGAEDLLQEALLRTLDTRKCPTGVDVVRCLAQIMRSLAHGEIEKAKSRPAIASPARSDDPQAALLNLRDPSPSAEEEMIARETYADIHRGIKALFDDDPEAWVIVVGIMEGLSAAELRDLSGLGETAYDSKRKLIRRRINKAFPEGWKP